MHYAVIIAGGSGTRLWPVSRAAQPKQLIRLFEGKSLLEMAMDRLAGLVPADRQYVCAGRVHQQQMLDSLPGLDEHHFLAEPVGRDTLNAVGLAAAVIGRRDPDAVIAVLTADHVIEPTEQFQAIVARGFDLAEQQPDSLVTFGIAPTRPATSFGYLQLAEGVDDQTPPARRVAQFKEKPDLSTAEAYVDAGTEQYLWNSGMFVWRATTLLDCIRQYAPENHAGLLRIAEAWDTPERNAVLDEVYPGLAKTSIDYAVMEPASKAHGSVRIVAVPMDLTWLDVGSWPAFAQTCQKDANDNALGQGLHLLGDCSDVLAVSSDPDHLIAAIGCEDLIIVHTPDATLVCRADRAEDIKKLYAKLAQQLGDAWL